MKNKERIFKWFSFFKSQEGIAIATWIDPYPSGFPNFSQIAFFLSSVKHSYALVNIINLAAASGESFLSGCQIKLNYLIKIKINF